MRSGEVSFAGVFTGFFSIGVLCLRFVSGLPLTSVRLRIGVGFVVIRETGCLAGAGGATVLTVLLSSALVMVLTFLLTGLGETAFLLVEGVLGAMVFVMVLVRLTETLVFL
ncbi:MAG: hypothetical protein PVG93_05785 [Phycisphaerales bacterium]